MALSLSVGDFPGPAGLTRDPPEIILNLMVFQVGESKRAPELAEVNSIGVMRREENKIRTIEQDHFCAHLVVRPESRIRVRAWRHHRYDVVFIDDTRQRQETQPLHAIGGGETRLPERDDAFNWHAVLDQVNCQNSRNRAAKRVSGDVGLVSRPQIRLQVTIYCAGGGIEACVNGNVDLAVFAYGYIEVFGKVLVGVGPAHGDKLRMRFIVPFEKISDLSPIRR